MEKGEGFEVFPKFNLPLALVKVQPLIFLDGNWHKGKKKLQWSLGNKLGF